MSEIIFEKEEGGKRAILYGRGGTDPEIYADGIWGFALAHGAVCKFTFYTGIQSGSPNEIRRQIAFRLAVPIPVMVAMRDYFNDRVNDLIKSGVLEVTTVTPTVSSSDTPLPGQPAKPDEDPK